MLDEAATNPAPEVSPTNPAPEVETEATGSAPEDQFDEATEGTDEDQSTDTDAEGDDTSEGTKAEEERLAGMREADYRKKTQELAEIRKGIEARTQRLDAIVQQGEVLLNALHEDIQSEFGGIDWGKLAAEDPAEYVRMQHRLSEKQRRVQAALYRLNEAQQARNQSSQEAQTETLKEQREKLLEALPEWRDQSKYQAESAALADYLTKSGYDQTEAFGVTDHRAVLIARKAMLYDRLMAKVPKATPKPTAPPPAPPAPTKAKAAPDPEKMPMDQWLKWRERQLAKKRG